METNETRTLWISIGSAVFAVVLLYGWAQDKRATMARKFGQTKTVVVAREDILEAQIIDESKLEVVEKPSDFIQPAAVQNPIDIVGQIALAPIKKGEQILDTKLTMIDKSTGLSMQVAPGKRAVTVPVNEVQGVAKLIKPGDRVDIIAGVDDGQGVNKERKIRTLLQNVAVLATGQQIVDNLPIEVVQGNSKEFEIRNLRVENNYSTITIEVDPGEAQDLLYLTSIAAPVFFTLRNPNDRSTGLLPISDINNVLARRPAAAQPKKVAPPKDTKKTTTPKTPAKKPQQEGGRYESL